MSETVLKPGDTWRNNRGEVRTIVRIERTPSSTQPGKPRPRVVWCGADQVETTCRTENFIKWKRHGNAVIVESEGV